MTPSPVCEACSDDGDVFIAGVLYCGRCGLLRLIQAMRAEIGEAPEQAPEPVRPAPVLVDR